MRIPQRVALIGQPTPCREHIVLVEVEDELLRVAGRVHLEALEELLLPDLQAPLVELLRQIVLVCFGDSLALLQLDVLQDLKPAGITSKF